MTSHFDRFQSAIVRIVPDFGLLKVGPHRTDPRASASVVIAGMVLGLSLVIALAIAPPGQPLAPRASGEKVAPPPAADKVTVISGTPQSDLPCTEQTWPYIDRRCLTESTEKRPGPNPRTQETASAPPPLDARSATAPVIPATAPPAASSETDGVAARDTANVAQPRAANDFSEAAELEEDAQMIAAEPPREMRRQDRRRSGHRQPHLSLPFLGRIF
jgi:hypothetical protein